MLIIRKNNFKSMNEKQLYFLKIFEEVVDLVYKEERFMLNFTGGNRKGLKQLFMFRTGIHLSKLVDKYGIDGLDLDSEYNKNHDLPKITKRYSSDLKLDSITM